MLKFEYLFLREIFFVGFLDFVAFGKDSEKGGPWTGLGRQLRFQSSSGVFFDAKVRRGRVVRGRIGVETFGSAMRA